MKKAQQRVNGEIPTSSMADIAFLLIIYFVLTMAFSATKGLDVGLPEEDPQARVIDPVESILVEIPAGSEPLLVNGNSVQLENLLSVLAPTLRVAPDKPVILKTQAEAEYGRAVRVLDKLRQGKSVLDLVEDIQIVLPTQREIDLYW